MSDFGSSLFKVQTGTATYADMASVLDSIVLDERTRSRCGGLSALVSDIPESSRREYAAAFATLYFHRYYPESDPSPPTYDATTQFLDQCCPPPRSRWKDHVVASYDKKGKPGRAHLTEEVGRVMYAIEQLWNVPSYLVQKR